MPIIGTPAQRLAALNQRAEVYTINYDNIPWLTEQFSGKAKWPFKTVVADESTRLKGFRLRGGGRRALALGKVAHAHVDRWVNLTGTPAPNGLIDLWGQGWFVDAGKRLGRTMDDFKMRWFRTFNEPQVQKKGYTYDVPVTKPVDWAQEQIEDALYDVTMSVRAEDYFDLREPIVRDIRVELPAKARALYRDMEKRMFMELAGYEVEAVNAAAKTMKCLQLANGAAYVDDDGTWKEVHNAKIQALESIIEEAAGAPVLVAYHFKSDLARLQRAFPKGRLLDANASTIADWNAGHIPILFAHPASAGHGLNLQDGGNIIAFFGQWWDLEQHDQIIERIGPMRQHQAGHDRPVWVYYIIADGTLDDTVKLRRETKRSVNSLLMQAMKENGYA